MKVINNELRLSTGQTLEASQVQSICAGSGGNRASDDQIREYLNSEGWDDEAVKEFIAFVHSPLANELQP